MLRTEASLLAGAMRSSKMPVAVFCPSQIDMQREKQRIAFTVFTWRKTFSQLFQMCAFQHLGFYEGLKNNSFPSKIRLLTFFCLGLHKTIKPCLFWETEILTIPLPPLFSPPKKIQLSKWAGAPGKHFGGSCNSLPLQCSTFPLRSVAKAGKMKGHDVQSVQG